MKQLQSTFVLGLLFLATTSISAQNQIHFQSQSNRPVEPSAMLDIYSEDKGFLIPRMTESEKLLINEPAESLLVYQTDVNPGFYYFTDNHWEKIQDKSESVPIGTIIEWWRPNANFPVPEGYAICDGSIITDSDSPYFNKIIPNLLDRYVKGVTDINLIGATTDGNHNHQVDPPQVTSNTSGAHTHSLSLDFTLSWDGSHTHDLFIDPFTTDVKTHNHHWVTFDVDLANFFDPTFSWRRSSGSLMVEWFDGVDNTFGSGYFTLGLNSTATLSDIDYYTDNNDHGHIVDFGNNTVSNSDHRHSPFQNVRPSINTTGDHHHTLDIPATNTSAIHDIDPPFYGMLRIIKIK